jgi:hypothetical protein
MMLLSFTQKTEQKEIPLFGTSRNKGLVLQNNNL